MTTFEEWLANLWPQRPPLTYVKATKAHGPDDWERWEETQAAATLSTHGLGLPGATLISSAAASHAKTSPSPARGPGSQAHAPASSTSSRASRLPFNPPGCSSRTYPDCSPRTAVGTSESCLPRWPTSGTAWPGGCSTHVTSESPSGAVECSLSDILEATTDERYLLSARAARGVLRRAGARGRRLPDTLEDALLAAAL